MKTYKWNLTRQYTLQRPKQKMEIKHNTYYTEKPKTAISRKSTKKRFRIRRRREELETKPSKKGRRRNEKTD